MSFAQQEPPPEEAAPLPEEPSLLASPVELHGFVSQGFLLSAGNEYLANSKTGSLEFSEVGVNLTKTLPQNLRLGVQLFAHDLGPFGNFAPQFDWYYLDWRPRDYLGLRVGRLKMPFGLYNELNDIDAARVPILLPQSIYQADHREYLFALAGGELYGDLRLGAAGSLEYRAYGGTLPGQLPASPNPVLNVTRAAVPYVYGGRLLWSTPLDGLVAGFSAQAVRFDFDIVLDPAVRAALEGAGVLPAGSTNPLLVKFRVPRWIASLQYAADDLDLTAEYSRWIGEFYSPAPALFPPHIVNERYYAMVSYHLSSWFTPGLYYSGYFVNVKDRHGRENYQHDLAATTRYDLTANWLLKLEGHLMVGTAGLDNKSLNGGAEQKTLARTLPRHHPSEQCLRERGAPLSQRRVPEKGHALAGGRVVYAVDQAADAAVRQRFSERVLRRSVFAVRSYWQQHIFAGRGLPPPELASDEAVLRYVRSRPGAVGYVSENADVAGVKVLNVR